MSDRSHAGTIVSFGGQRVEGARVEYKFGGGEQVVDSIGRIGTTVGFGEMKIHLDPEDEAIAYARLAGVSPLRMGFAPGDRIRVGFSSAPPVEVIVGVDDELWAPGSIGAGRVLQRQLNRRSGTHVVVRGPTVHVWCVRLAAHRKHAVEIEASRFGFTSVRWHLAEHNGVQREPTFACRRKDHDCSSNPGMARDCWMLEHGA